MRCRTECAFKGDWGLLPLTSKMKPAAVRADFIFGVVDIGETEIAKNNGANWTVSAAGVITLKTAYLDTLSEGDTVFTVVFSQGASASFTVAVSDTTPAG